MKSMMKISQELTTLLGHFDANIAWSDEVPNFLTPFSSQRIDALKSEMKNMMDQSLFDTEQFYQATSCTAKDDRSARRFFKDVYAYAFEDGEDPDIANYWNR